VKTCLPLKTNPTYYAVFRAGLWHAQREYEGMNGRNCLCVVDDMCEETDERYLEDQVITCLTCQVMLARST